MKAVAVAAGMRRRRLHRVFTLVATTALLLTGVDAAANPVESEAQLAYRFPAPDEGGEWLLELEAGSLSRYLGPQEITVRLQSIDGYTPDGTLQRQPVLTYVFDEDETQWQHHFLSSAGSFGYGAPVRLTGIGGAVWEWTGLVFTAELVAADYPSWHYLGPYLWGEELTVGQTLTRTVSYQGGGLTDLEIVLVAVDGEGCATYEHRLLGAHVATLDQCDDPLPHRIVVHDATLTWFDGRPLDIRGDTIHVTPVTTGGQLVDAPSWQPHDAQGFTGHPPDGSELPLTLEEAYDALADHPVAGAWLDEHPDALALEGRYGARLCEVADETPCPNQVGVLGQGLDEILGEDVMSLEREVHEWRVRFVTPAGDWMQARVVRPARSVPAPALVASSETGSGSAPGTLPAEVVALSRTLELWEEVTQGRYRVERIAWDLGAQDPVWIIWSELEKTEPGGGRATGQFHVSMETGLILGGFVPTGIYSASPEPEPEQAPRHGDPARG